MPKENETPVRSRVPSGRSPGWPETAKPIAQDARDLGINEGTLGNWIARDQAARDGSDRSSREGLAELKRLRAEVAELRMERDVLKRAVVLWVLSRCRHKTHYVEYRIIAESVDESPAREAVSLAEQKAALEDAQAREITRLRAEVAFAQITDDEGVAEWFARTGVRR
jgi:transposase